MTMLLSWLVCVTALHLWCGLCIHACFWPIQWYIYVVYISVAYYSAIKKEILAFVTTWLDFEVIMLSEISWTKEDKYYMISLMCGILKKQKPTHRYREQIGGCQRLGLPVGQNE